MFKFLAVFTCLLALSLALYPYAEKDNIINLGDPTWETALNEFPAGLVVYFYEPYCYPCRQFWPELHKTAQDLVAVGSAAKITKVECHDEIKLCNSRQVFTFPTVLLHKGWRSFEYRGARNSESFTTWLRMAVDHVYPTINSEEDLFKRSSIIILLKDNESAGTINDVIMDLLDLDVEVVIAGPTVSSKLGSNNVVILSQAGDSVPVTGADVVAQVNTLRDKKTVAPEITWPVYQELKGNGAQDYAIFFRTNSFKSGSDAAKAFDKAYPEFFNQNVNFYYANVVGDLLGDTLAQHFGVHADDESTVGLVSQKDRILQKYKLSGAVTFDSIKQLIQDWRAGSGKRYYMTAEVPNGQSGYIKDLVSQNYYQAINDPKKSTLVMFYYPWCEPCVKLEPTWKALAYRLRDNDSVVVARIDISTNDVEGRDIADCPKIFFYPAGDSKTVAEYTGELNVKGLKSFLFEKIPSLKTDMEL